MKNIISPIIKEVNTVSAVINYFTEVLVDRMSESSIFDITKENILSN